MTSKALQDRDKTLYLRWYNFLQNQTTDSGFHPSGSDKERDKLDQWLHEGLISGKLIIFPKRAIKNSAGVKVAHHVKLVGWTHDCTIQKKTTEVGLCLTRAQSFVHLGRVKSFKGPACQKTAQGYLTNKCWFLNLSYGQTTDESDPKMWCFCPYMWAMSDFIKAVWVWQGQMLFICGAKSDTHLLWL